MKGWRIRKENNDFLSLMQQGNKRGELTMFDLLECGPAF